MTAIGSVVALALLITGHKPEMYGHCIHFKVGNNWGGLELGMFFLTDRTPSDSTKNHEHGHGFQNAVLGPLFPFLVAIPSATRYWLREQNTRKGKTIFSSILYAILMVVAISLAVLAICTQPWVWVFSIFIAAYSTLLYIWLMRIEIPKYDRGYVDYDAIWFEGEATRLGNEYINKWD
jgi:hypothetical protein